MRPDAKRIVDAQSDQEVLDLVVAELERRIDASLHDDLDAYVIALQGLPKGLGAMAATYQLDVSMTLDDLGWHFGNWHHHGYSLETARGLRELGAIRAAELFEAAYSTALQYWDELGSEGWIKWYHGSAFEKAIDPLSSEMWDLLGDDLRVMKYWVAYARRHPEILGEPGDGTAS